MDENGYNWPSKRVWKTVESQGKVSKKSGKFEMDIEWQPWKSKYPLYSLVPGGSWLQITGALHSNNKGAKFRLHNLINTFIICSLQSIVSKLASVKI